MNVVIDDNGGNFIIEKLEDKGFPAFYVGGCVRDSILGRAVFDYDITTAAKPDDVMRIFSEEKIVTSGIKHGTVTVILNGKPYEVTTFRKEGKYSDNRHPDRVFFCRSVNDDLSRRDFTCNAMAYCKKQGLIDNCGGFYDAHNRILRAVGVPVTRFKEDALRILRALRFSSALSFSIEKRTADAVVSQRHLLRNVSAERIYGELKKIFCGENALNVLLEFADVIAMLVYPYADFRREKYDSAVRACCSAQGGFELKFAVFCYTLYGGDLPRVLKLLDNFKADNYIKKIFSVLFVNADLFFGGTEVSPKRLLRKIYPEFYEEFFIFAKAAPCGNSSDIRRVERLKFDCDGIIGRQECFTLKTLAVNGNDLKSIGIVGKNSGVVLEFLLGLVIDGKAENDKNELLRIAKESVL